MKRSPRSKVRQLYENTADSYSQMMDAEIDLPIYADILSRLAARIAPIDGPVLDTSCGSGHMLSRYHERYDPKRPLIGIDLSPSMVEISKNRLGPAAEVRTGDMRNLEGVEPLSLTAVMSFFAIHHLGPNEIPQTLQKWRRLLRPGGQLVVAIWEGTGPIDYGGESDVVALRYSEGEILDWTQSAGFVVDRCVVEPVEEIPMDAIYLEATRQ